MDCFWLKFCFYYALSVKFSSNSVNFSLKFLYLSLAILTTLYFIVIPIRKWLSCLGAIVTVRTEGFIFKARLC
jgi:uncharacterized membrane protein